MFLNCECANMFAFSVNELVIWFGLILLLKHKYTRTLAHALTHAHAHTNTLKYQFKKNVAKRCRRKCLLD